MSKKPPPRKAVPLTAAIIAYMKPREERGDAQCPGLRVRCLASGRKVFLYRYVEIESCSMSHTPGLLSFSGAVQATPVRTSVRLGSSDDGQGSLFTRVGLSLWPIAS